MKYPFDYAEEVQAIINNAAVIMNREPEASIIIPIFTKFKNRSPVNIIKLSPREQYLAKLFTKRDIRLAVEIRRDVWQSLTKREKLAVVATILKRIKIYGRTIRIIDDAIVEPEERIIDLLEKAIDIKQVEDFEYCRLYRRDKTFEVHIPLFDGYSEPIYDMIVKVRDKDPHFLIRYSKNDSKVIVYLRNPEVARALAHAAEEYLKSQNVFDLLVREAKRKVRLLSQ